MFNKITSEFSSGYFGKLPEFNDFIKFNAGSPEIFFVDNWLQTGLAYAKANYKSEWKEKYDNLRPTGFFLPVTSSNKVVTGMLYPGKDRSGREFPFLIFSLIPGSHFDKFHFIPAAIQPVLAVLDEMLRKENELNSLNNALKNYTIILPHKESLQQKFNEYLSDTSVIEFLKRTKLNYNALKTTDLIYTDSTFIRISFSSDTNYFGFDAGTLIYLLDKKITLTFRHSSIFWSRNDDEKFNITIFPLQVTAVNFVDLLSICNDNRILNLFSEKYSEENNHLENKLSLKQLLQIS